MKEQGGGVSPPIRSDSMLVPVCDGGVSIPVRDVAEEGDEFVGHLFMLAHRGVLVGAVA